MNHKLRHQQGMTLISFLLMFVVLGFLMLMVLKIAPIYLEHFKIKSTLNTLKVESGIGNKSPAEITGLLQKRWDMNSVDRVSAQDSVTVEKHEGVLKIQVAYEVEEHLIGNLSALVKFDDSIETEGRN